jgi:TolA-binding protein
LADSFYAEGELEKALLIYAYAAQEYFWEEWGQRSRLRLADLSLEKERDRVTDLAFYHSDYSEPLKTYEEIAKGSAYPEVLELALMKLGGLLDQQGDYQGAYFAFKEIEREYISSRYYKQAKVAAHGAVKKVIDSLYYQNDFLSVVNFYPKNQAEIEQEPDPHLLFQVATSGQNMGLYTLAASLYRRAAKYSSQTDGLSQEILLNLGKVYNQDEKYGLAEKTIRDFLIKYGKTTSTCRAYPVMISALYHQEKFSEAINFYLRSLKICPQNKNNIHINYLVGTSYYNTGNISQAKTSFEQVLHLLPKASDRIEGAIPLSGSLPIQLGNSFYGTKDYKAAAEVYNEALKLPGIKDTSPWIIYQLGRSYQKQGLKKEAQKAYKELLSQTDDPFWKDLAQVWLD